MNTFWQKFRPSINDPKRMKANLVRIFEKSHVGDVFTIDDLTDMLKAESKKSVAFILGDLRSAQKVDQIVQVVSPKNGGGIERYSEIGQVPASLFDPYQNLDIEVEPRLIRIYFTKHVADERSPSERLNTNVKHHVIA